MTNEGYLKQDSSILRPHQSPVVTAVPLFVTFGDISPRRGENLSLPVEAFIQRIAPVFRATPYLKKNAK